RTAGDGRGTGGPGGSGEGGGVNGPMAETRRKGASARGRGAVWLGVTAVVCLGGTLAACAGRGGSAGEWTPAFDGATLAGWEGNTEYFAVEEGAIVGGT